MLVRCLYASRPTQPLDGGVLDQILEQSRRNNPTRGLSGLLCVSENLFLQALEGGRDEVCDLLGAIVRDNRHRDVRLLVYSEISERRFGSWTMGQVHIDRLNPALLLKYFKRPELDPFECSGQASLSLLAELVDSGAIAMRGE